MAARKKKKVTDENGRTKRRTLLDKNIAFQVTEAYKNLRTNITFALSTKKNKVFAVSSALASEGKSTVTANIAITLAQTDSDVLLIDCDLRKPVQHKVFDLKNEVGISSLIGGISSFDETVHKDVIPHLDIITCGKIPPNPSEMLGSENMDELLKEAAQNYDYVIIDTPPINIVTDALTLMGKIAGLLLVAQHGSSTYDALEEAIDSVKMADGAILGVVVNNMPVGSGKFGKYGKYGKYKYKYKYNYNYTYGNNNRINNDEDDDD